MSTLVNSVYITSAFLCFYLTALLFTLIPAYIHSVWSQLAELVQWGVWACQCSHQQQGLEFCHSNLEQCVYLAFCFLCLLCLLTRFLSLVLNDTSWPCCSDTYIFVTIRTFHSCVGIIFDFFQFLFILSSLLIFQYDNTRVSNLPHLSFFPHQLSVDLLEKWEEKDQQPPMKIHFSTKDGSNTLHHLSRGGRRHCAIASQLKNRFLMDHYQIFLSSLRHHHPPTLGHSFNSWYLWKKFHQTFCW